jgi:hypothetical protein
MAPMGLKRIEYDDAAGSGDDTLLPSQFWSMLADPRSEPEKRLMVAVLEEAISVVVNGAARDDERRAVVREADRWFASDDRANPFAFASICDVLDLDAGQVRQALSGWQCRQRLFRRPRLQAGRGRHQVRSGERGPRRAA